MAFDQSPITDGPLFARHGLEWLVRWTSSAPANTIFQVYLDRRLVWHGTSRRCVVGGVKRRARVDVGAVGPTEGPTDFSGSLPAMPGDGHVLLGWAGGTYLADDIAGFNVYRGTVAWGAVDYSARIAFVPAYRDGVVTDGYGEGGYGEGGYGGSSAHYRHTDTPPGSGEWHYGIRPVNRAGVEGTATEVTEIVLVPPAPPAYNPATRSRLSVSYDDSTGVATLTWLASPG